MLALVAIGRNEGERLRRCLASVVEQVDVVVYVDSGSTDGSVAMARGMGVEVVELDMRQPFTAARARNAGFERVRERLPQVRWVQFVDGDCEVMPGWLEAAVAFLQAHADVAAVCGQRRERYPDRSVYNRLCDLEWAMPEGPVKACGGDVMMRAQALQQAGGYRADLIAGEEPELCVRLRGAGWRIHALDRPMTLHDAAMTRFSQWWRRMKRGGYADALGASLHGAPPERHRVWESRRTWIWGLGPPLLCLALWPAMGAWALFVWAVYPLQMLRLYLRGQGNARDRRLTAVFQTIGRFPELAGQWQALRDRWSGRAPGLIEYK